jgi:hypothetical protein
MCGPVVDQLAPADVAEALVLIEAGLDFLNGADLPGVPVGVLGESLRVWSRLEAKRTAAEAGLVVAFDAAQGGSVDGQSSTSAWLAVFTRCTKASLQGCLCGDLFAGEQLVGAGPGRSDLAEDLAVQDGEPAVIGTRPVPPGLREPAQILFGGMPT